MGFDQGASKAFLSTAEHELGQVTRPERPVADGFLEQPDGFVADATKGAKGIATRSDRKLLGAPGLTSRSKDATRSK